MRSRSWITIVEVAVAGWLLAGCGAKGIQMEKVRVGTTEIRVEVAETRAEQERGLSGREKLAADKGMLFTFSQKRRYPFWMKEMKFPLDFIWIDSGKVVEATENILIFDREGAVSVIYPGEEVDGVIEVNAGFIRAHRVTVGDKFEVLK